MRNFLAFIFILAPLACFGDTSPSIDVTKVTENLHILKFSTNIGVISIDETVILVDPMPGKEHLAELESLIENLYQNPVKYILNTHDHEDHTGGNTYFSKKGIKVLSESTKLTGIDEIIVSSHSPKDRVFFHRQSNSIFVGDVYDNSWHPTFYYGGLRGFNDAIEGILSLGDENSLIIPGHGKPANKDALRKFRGCTLQWVGEVKALYSDNQNVEQIMNDEGIKNILQCFNTQNKSSFLPRKAVKRFIERTISLFESNR